MPIDVFALVQAKDSPSLVIGGQGDLLAIHEQLLLAANPDPDAGDPHLKAADLISQLSDILGRHPDSDPRTVNRVVAGVITGLRLGSLSGPAEHRRFHLADGWLDNLRIRLRAPADDDSSPEPD